MFQVPLINLNSFELVFLSACQFLDLVSPPLDFFCLTSFLLIFDYLPKLYRVQIPVYIFKDLSGSGHFMSAEYNINEEITATTYITNR